MVYGYSARIEQKYPEEMIDKTKFYTTLRRLLFTDGSKSTTGYHHILVNFPLEYTYRKFLNDSKV